jgi:predicted anti-sigma-YlaC factor YlaD
MCHNNKRNNMNCKTVQNKMTAYRAEVLEKEVMSEITGHIEGCAACQKIYAELNETLNLIDKRKRLDENPYLYTRIKQRLESEKILKPKSAFKRILQPAFLSLLILFSVYFGIQLGLSYQIDSVENELTETSTSYYFNDMEHENIEVLLLNDE